MAEPLTILYEDPHCLAVIKLAGELTQGVPADGPTLEGAVRRHLCPEDPASVYLGTVHRLDRPVSGVVLWAKTPKAARRLAAEFASREALKEYWAVVEGVVPVTGLAVAWEDWLLSPERSGVARTVDLGAPGARRAVTRMRTDRADALPEQTSWLRLWPETGRTHQLRVQASSRGLAILGDRVYGSNRPFGPGIALHARSLRIRHPILRGPLELVAPLPSCWAEQGIVLPEGPRSPTSPRPSRSEGSGSS